MIAFHWLEMQIYILCRLKFVFSIVATLFPTCEVKLQKEEVNKDVILTDASVNIMLHMLIKYSCKLSLYLIAL